MDIHISLRSPVFFTTLVLLVLLWAQIYYQVLEHPPNFVYVLLMLSRLIIFVVVL
jgi:hypothetical protein